MAALPQTPPPTAARRKRLEVAYEQSDEAPSAASTAEEHPAGDGHELALEDNAVLPEPGDNCAILRRRLAAGTRVRLFSGEVVSLSATVLEGHRLAVAPVAQGRQLLSWGLPFGVASRDIMAGEYVCNASVLSALRLRQVEELPQDGNFDDAILPYDIDEASFQGASQVPMLPPERRLTFLGYDRSEAQGGVGTRNFVVVVPTSAFSSPLARRLAESMGSAASSLENCDGVVAMAHTEAGIEAGGQRPRNWDLLLQTLAGFVSHPNVAAALVVGYGGELLSPAVLRAHIEDAGRPLPRWCRFLALKGRFEDDLAAGRDVLMPWLSEVNQCRRTPQPLAHLRVALQCGGSDAFSGVSGNPSAGAAAKLLIEHGGAAVLAETDELIGAESYVLSRTRDLETARQFLGMVRRFKERFSWHGQSAESNPSGGNKLRGLYNIVLKSLGAAKKKHADVALDGVLDYSQRLPEGQRGYYFMDSPGNDLESIAGQVASGCNAIFFITGNGAITNFPFVPTVKIITTTERFRLLERDMDFNAGRFQDDRVPMDQLGQELFDELLRVSSGGRSAGELAGHSQVSIWREWAQDGPVADPASLRLGEREGAPIFLSGLMPTAEQDDGDPDVDVSRIVKEATFDSAADERRGTERLGLILPTSLCSGEIARKAADELNTRREDGSDVGSSLSKLVDRFVSLPHTEGCGNGYSGDGEEIFSRILFGHLLHVNITRALLLEHGCEKNHNAWMTEELRRRGIEQTRFGFASAQTDGGIDNVLAKVCDWFVAEATGLLAAVPGPLRQTSPLASLPIALLSDANSGGTAVLGVGIIRAFVGAGGTVVVPSSAAMLNSGLFLDELCSGRAGAAAPSLAFAQPFHTAGAHIMHVPAGVNSTAEVVAGLVAAGAGVVLVVRAGTGGKAVPTIGHPLVHVLYIVTNDEVFEEEPKARQSHACCDLTLARRACEGHSARSLRWLRATIELVCQVASGRRRPAASDTVAFQVARGPTGVSA